MQIIMDQLAEEIKQGTISSIILNFNKNWEVTLVAPSNSHYDGAIFTIEVSPTMDVWTWMSPIYHPYFQQNQTLCHSMIKEHNGLVKTPSEIIKNILVLLREPYVWMPCDFCCKNPSALMEMQTDYPFFLRKSRCHTPGSKPLSDEEIRNPLVSLAPMNLNQLLMTGTYSDVTILVKKSKFNCHRTILSAHSPVFKKMFAEFADQGIVKFDFCSPQIFARFLKYIYAAKVYNIPEVTPLELVELAVVAEKLRVTPLQKYYVSLLINLAADDNDQASILLKYAREQRCELLERALSSLLCNHFKSFSISSPEIQKACRSQVRKERTAPYLTTTSSAVGRR